MNPWTLPTGDGRRREEVEEEVEEGEETQLKEEQL